MKKLTTIIAMFLFINHVNADTLQEQFINLKTDYYELEEKIENIENTRLDKIYPIGSIYETTNYSTVEQVNEALGGTWERYGNGKTLVGVDSTDESFNTVNKTGGTSTTTLVTANLPSHTHSIPALSGTAASAGAHTHTRGTMNIAGSFKLRGLPKSVDNAMGGTNGAFSTTVTSWSGAHKVLSFSNVNPANYDAVTFTASNNWTGATSSAGAHTHTVNTTANTTGAIGSGVSFTNLGPYITVYRYKRIS